VSSFRCYALDHSGQILLATNVEAADTEAAVDLGWRFIASHQARNVEADRCQGLEIWQRGNLVFTTVKDRLTYASRPAR
jgi:hypothetical protein